MSALPLAAFPHSNQPIAAELNAAALAHFSRFGWCASPGFFSATEVADLLRCTEEITALPEVRGRHMLYREANALDADSPLIQRIENFCPHHDEFDRIVRRGRLHRAVEQLFGEPAVLFKEKINFKMPGAAGFEAHQDQQAGWSLYAPIFMTALVAIDPATIENGCLELSTMQRQSQLIGEEWKPLTEAQMAGHAFEPVPTAPGDVLFFDSYVPHASKPNMTNRQRRILYLTFNQSAHGDHRAKYFADKRASFPPDIEREPGTTYRFRV
jgi:hypothetical protein